MKRALLFLLVSTVTFAQSKEQRYTSTATDGGVGLVMPNDAITTFKTGGGASLQYSGTLGRMVSDAGWSFLGLSRLGIGTTDPQESVEIASGGLDITGAAVSGSSDPALHLQFTGGNTGWVQSSQYGGNAMDLNLVAKDYFFYAGVGTPTIRWKLDQAVGGTWFSGVIDAGTNAVMIPAGTYIAFANEAGSSMRRSAAGVVGVGGSWDINQLGTTGNLRIAGAQGSAGDCLKSGGTGAANTWGACANSGVPTISSGFGTDPSVTGNTAAMRINVGTGGSANAGVIGLPAATTGWNCFCNDITTFNTTIFICRQTGAGTSTTVPIGQFDSSGSVAAWGASNILAVNCEPY